MQFNPSALYLRYCCQSSWRTLNLSFIKICLSVNFECQSSYIWKTSRVSPLTRSSLVHWYIRILQTYRSRNGILKDRMSDKPVRGQVTRWPGVNGFGSSETLEGEEIHGITRKSHLTIELLDVSWPANLIETWERCPDTSVTSIGHVFWNNPFSISCLTYFILSRMLTWHSSTLIIPGTTEITMALSLPDSVISSVIKLMLRLSIKRRYVRTKLQRNWLYSKWDCNYFLMKLSFPVFTQHFDHLKAFRPSRGFYQNWM